MKVNLPVIVWLGVLVLASCLIVVGVVCRTIALHPDAMGFLS